MLNISRKGAKIFKRASKHIEVTDANACVTYWGASALFIIFASLRKTFPQ